MRRLASLFLAFALGFAPTADAVLRASSAAGRASAQAIPAPFIIGKSFAAVSGAADTNENTLATISIPAGAIGANGCLRVRTFWTVNNNANAKTTRIRLSAIGGTIFTSLSHGAVTTGSTDGLICNRNAQNSQYAYALTLSGNSTAISTATGSVETSVATTMVITAQKATGSDTMTLEGYTVELLSDGT